MEIIIAFAVFCVALWWFFIRDDKKPEASVSEVKPEVAPYKVETQPVELGKSADDRVETPAPVAETKPAKPKAPAKPRAPAKPKATASTTAKPKAPAKAKAPAKTPAKPKIKVAK
jgi:hypothetical protein